MNSPDAETVYSVNQVARMLALSRWSVVRMFKHEPGVVVWGSAVTTKRARKYRTLRIPQFAINRVINRRKV